MSHIVIEIFKKCIDPMLMKREKKIFKLVPGAFQQMKNW